ncbi:MAG: hypothetical protein BLITH_1063 [Brockia lithotrophica]|uniref:Uncharacterized protein n=1 Tax=Brockia lithotrophica TaxID=933949 RepID=A0A2T5G7D0_9BACL|nr:MAG: hypothetical protein BLITH_1063 [Brockia lithotrophica]
MESNGTPSDPRTRQRRPFSAAGRFPAAVGEGVERRAEGFPEANIRR